MRRILVCLGTLLVASALLAACSGNNAGRRTVEIVQTDAACTPAGIAVKNGEKLSLQVRNDGKQDHEIEGIEGTKIPEVTVPSGRSRTVSFDVPAKGGVSKIKCYILGGSTTIVQLSAGSDSATPAVASANSSLTTNKQPQLTVDVGLTEFTVTPSTDRATPGPVRFAAHNTSTTMFHELAVLRVKADGTFENAGEMEGLGPGISSAVTLDLPAGNYLLACLIAPGENGSTVDHFQQGMKTPFTVS